MMTTDATPIPMRIPCPRCGTLHIDEGEFATKPHHTHACQSCGEVWRPAVVATVGVRFLPGFKNEAAGGEHDWVAMGLTRIECRRCGHSFPVSRDLDPLEAKRLAGPCPERTCCNECADGGSTR
jgi:hypothetical protein